MEVEVEEAKTIILGRCTQKRKRCSREVTRGSFKDGLIIERLQTFYGVTIETEKEMTVTSIVIIIGNN